MHRVSPQWERGLNLQMLLLETTVVTFEGGRLSWLRCAPAACNMQSAACSLQSVELTRWFPPRITVYCLSFAFFTLDSGSLSVLGVVCVAFCAAFAHLLCKLCSCIGLGKGCAEGFSGVAVDWGADVDASVGSVPHAAHACACFVLHLLGVNFGSGSHVDSGLGQWQWL